MVRSHTRQAKSASSFSFNFGPHVTSIRSSALTRMRRAARRKVVLVEPVRNNSSSPLWGWFARWASRVDGRDVPFHFDEQSLARLLDPLGGQQQRDLICAGRDIRAVLDARDYGAATVERGGALCAKTS